MRPEVSIESSRAFPIDHYEVNKTDKIQKKNSELSEEILRIFVESKGRYGVRRMHQTFLNCGHAVDHKRAQHIMHRLGLLSKRPNEKYHSYKGEVGRVADNIINRDFSTEKPLQKWTTDVIAVHLFSGVNVIFPQSSI